MVLLETGTNKPICGGMVFILDGISFLDGNLCYLTCIRLLISSRAGTNQVFLPEKTYFQSCVRNI